MNKNYCARICVRNLQTYFLAAAGQSYPGKKPTEFFEMKTTAIPAPSLPTRARRGVGIAPPTPRPLRARWGCVALLIAAFCLAQPGRARAVQAVTLAWNPSADASVVGYRIQSREENALPTTINVGGLTQVTLPGLKEGLRYTFTVTSYNGAGIESAPSNPADVLVPVPLVLVPGGNANALKRLQFPMAPGHWYELQASSDLKTWVTLWQTGVASVYGWTEFQDPLSGASPVPNGARGRFYRLLIH